MSQLISLKSCPRCKGDITTNRDIYGTYKECLQCGYMADVESRDELLASLLPHAKKKVA